MESVFGEGGGIMQVDCFLFCDEAVDIIAAKIDLELDVLRMSGLDGDMREEG